MSAEKIMTVKILRERRKVSDEVKENLKQFNKDKKSLLTELGQGEKTIAQLSKATGISRDKTMFLVMSLVKFGYASVGSVDDNDEYFTYKIKKNEQN